VAPGATNKVADEYTQYHFDLDLGQSEKEDADESIWWLDATRQGSIFRFAKDNCNSNAQVDNGRCGTYSHILYKYSLSGIANRTVHYKLR
jgi:hypothetical protein